MKRMTGRGRPNGRTPRRLLFTCPEPLEARLFLSATTAEIAQALDLPEGVAVSYDGDTEAVQTRVLLSSGGLIGFPSGRDEDFLLFSTGVASEMDTVENEDGSQGTDLGPSDEEGDTAVISFTLSVPASSEPQRLKFDFIYLSEEYDEWVGSAFNDFFTANVNSVNIALDQYGQVVDVNNVFFDGTLSTDGTFFDGRTAMLQAQYLVPAGTTTLDIELSVGDRGDGIYDSGVLLDNFRIEARQRVWLNFEGQNNLTFAEETWDVPAFQPADLGYAAGTTRATVISDIVATLQSRYSGYDVQFTTTRPSSGDYSTVHIGGDDASLNANPARTLFGQAQNVDVGNLIASDVAVVFSQEFGDHFSSETPAEVRDRLAITIAHELGHNIGLRHVDDSYGDDIMKKHAPIPGAATFVDQLSDLPAAEFQHWTDEASSQNDHTYLESVLGSSASQSTLTRGWQWLRSMMGKWVTIGDAGSSMIYNVSLGTHGGLADVNGDGIIDADLAPQTTHLAQLKPGSRVFLPNYTGRDSFFLIGSSTPGGATDITTGGLDASGQIGVYPAGIEWVGNDGSLLGDVPLYKAQSGSLTPFAQLQMAESAEVNVAPTDITLTPNSVPEQQPSGTVVGILSATDPNSDETHTWTLLDNAGGRFSLSGNQLVIANGALIDALAAGSHVIQVRVTDTGGLSYDESLTLAVTPVNHAPVFAKGPDQVVMKGAPAQTVAAWATGISPGRADEAGQVLSFTVTVDNPALFSAMPVIAADGTLSYTPAAGASGSAIVSVVLRDSGGTANHGTDASAAQVFAITVNAPPAAKIFKPRAVTKGSTKMLAVKVVYNHAAGVKLSTLDAKDILLVKGSRKIKAKLVKFKASADGTRVTATYYIAAPDGVWDAGDNGNYQINLVPRQVKDIYGAASEATVLGKLKIGIG